MVFIDGSRCTLNETSIFPTKKERIQETVPKKKGKRDLCLEQGKRSRQYQNRECNKDVLAGPYPRDLKLIMY